MLFDPLYIIPIPPTSHTLNTSCVDLNVNSHNCLMTKCSLILNIVALHIIICKLKQKREPISAIHVFSRTQKCFILNPPFHIDTVYPSCDKLCTLHLSLIYYVGYYAEIKSTWMTKPLLSLGEARENINRIERKKIP